MGEAKRRPDISVLIPTRGRPRQVERAIRSLNASDAKIEILIGVDEDDATRSDIPELPHSRIIVGPRPRSQMVLVNELASQARGRILFPFPDDYIITTPDWATRLVEAVDRLPRGVGVVYPTDPLHPKFCSFPIITREMFNQVGYCLLPVFAYWFADTHWDEIGRMTGLAIQADFAVAAPEGKGRTHGLRDFTFWLDIFERLRPARIKESLELLGSAYDTDDERFKEAIRLGPQRVRECSQAIAHLRSPHFVAEVDNHSGDEPSDAYLALKNEAEQLVTALEQGQKRRLKIGICIPSGRSWEAGTAVDVAGLCAYSVLNGVDITLINHQSSMISSARNGTVEQALKERCDYLLFIDSDMRFPPSTLTRLLGHQKDIVGATYNKRVPPFETLGKLIGEGLSPDPDGLQEAYFLPGGMILVKADVYTKLRWPFYWESYRWPGKNGLDRFKTLMRDYFADTPSDEILDSLEDTEFGLWLQNHYHLGEFGEPFLYMSEDLNFCRKARKNGLKIWCDITLTYDVKHIGTLEIPCKDASKLTVDERKQMVIAGVRLPEVTE